MALYRWLRSLVLPPPSNRPFVLPQGSVQEAIAAIAALRSETAIRNAARTFPPRFGPAVVSQLRPLFDHLPATPPGEVARFPAATEWVRCCWVALYEVLYRYGEHAVPVLRSMAEAGYGGAVSILCRLAAAADSGWTVGETMELFPRLPPGSMDEAADTLLSLARSDAVVAEVLAALEEDPAFAESLALVRQYREE